MDSDIEEVDIDEPLQPRMSLFEEYGPKLIARMKKQLLSIQYEALKSLVKWFSADETKDQTAVV